jgi:hypothetical protein
MVNNTTDPFMTSTPKNNSNWWKWLIGILVVCICLGCVGTVGVLYYFGQEPETLSIDYSMPSVVHNGENFDLVITMTNTGNTTFTVDDIDLDELMGGSILDGAMVIGTEPEMKRDYSVSGIKSFVYNQTLEPGQTSGQSFICKR